MQKELNSHIKEILTLTLQCKNLKKIVHIQAIGACSHLDVQLVCFFLYNLLFLIHYISTLNYICKSSHHKLHTQVYFSLTQIHVQ